LSVFCNISAHFVEFNFFFKVIFTAMLTVNVIPENIDLDHELVRDIDERDLRHSSIRSVIINARDHKKHKIEE